MFRKIGRSFKYDGIQQLTKVTWCILQSLYQICSICIWWSNLYFN